MKPYLFAYNNFSESAQALARALNTQLIKHEHSRFVPSNNKVIINWGASNIPDYITNTCTVFNRPRNVQTAKNKLNTFEVLEGHVSIPPWTTDQQVAIHWLEEEESVVTRTILNGHEGHGIVIVKPGEELVAAPLYTKYIPKQAEYRVHVFEDEVIDIQQKVRRAENNNGNFHIRNTANGFIFARNVNGLPVHDTIPVRCKEEAVLAVTWLGLDFGAVDVIWNQHRQQAYVLEVNTAPGIEGTTVTNYNQAIRSRIDWNG